MTETYPHVFEPIHIGPVEVANRIFMGPHGIALEAPLPGNTAYRVPSMDAAHYYAERARGGVGLIFHSTTVGPMSRQTNVSATPWFDEAVPSYRRIADMIHEHGAKIMAQIWYVPFRVKAWERVGPEAPALGASAVKWHGARSVTHAMSQEDIRRLLDVQVKSARNLKEAGYDGIELHVAHGSILEHFLSPFFNDRSDIYGGSLENRLRIVRESLETVREAVLDEMAVGIRINADELLSGGLSEEDTAEALQIMESLELLDFVDLDVAVEPQQRHLMVTTYFEPTLHNLGRASRVAEALDRVPVLAAPGRLTSLRDAEQILADGHIDLVGAVRGLIAEPWLVNNARQGKESSSRTCIAANHCIEASATGGFGCAINPNVGREGPWLRTATRPERTCKVVVVGAGPAGLEAARVAGERGHSVVLFERRAFLGGGTTLWSRLPGREHLASFGGWYEERLGGLGVDVRLTTSATAQSILDEEPDVVILASGSRYSSTGETADSPRGIPGAPTGNQVAPEDVLTGAVTLRGKTVVIDEEGLHTAAGIAEQAARDGNEVHLITSTSGIAPALASSSQAPYVIARLHDAGVVLRPSTRVVNLSDRTVTIRGDYASTDEVIDDVRHVVLATMREPCSDLAADLSGQVEAVYTVGDALAPRGIREATYEGARFARLIGQDSMPSTSTEELFKPFPGASPAGAEVH